jgi:hypothetical protein
MNEDDKPPYTIESETRVRLGPVAREICRLNGTSERDMAKHLLQQHKLRQAGLAQRDGET